MTLEEKFENLAFDIPTEDCVKIAEDFAIGFAEWLLKFDNLKNENIYVIQQLLEIYKEPKEPKELLEIYKKEKTL